MGKLQQSWEKPRPEPLSCTHPIFAVVLNPTASMHQQTHQGNITGPPAQKASWDLISNASAVTHPQVAPAAQAGSREKEFSHSFNQQTFPEPLLSGRS